MGAVTGDPLTGGGTRVTGVGTAVGIFDAGSRDSNLSRGK